MTADKKPLSPEDAVRLLDLLCTDDDFRSQFAVDPAFAMTQVSDEAAASCHTCEPAGKLASKEEFAQARTELLKYLASHASFYVPHCFVAGKVDEQMKRKPRP